MTTRKPIERHFVLCVNNDDCADLDRRKVYQIIPDKEAEREGYVRVIDESGEDYLYPESYFIRLRLPHEAEKALASTR